MAAKTRKKEDCLVITRKQVAFAGPSGVYPRKMPTKKFVAKLKNQMGRNFDTPVLPAGTVFYGRRDDLEALIIEEQPGRRTIFWRDFEAQGTLKPGESYKYHLSFPYIIIGILVCNGRVVGHPLVYFRNKPVNSRTDKLYLTNLLNVIGSDLCPGKSLYPYGHKLNLQEIVRRLREAFWNDTFNRARHPSNYDEWAGKTTGSIEQWAERSKEDPLFALKVEWPSAGLTINQLIQKLLDRHGVEKSKAQHFELLMEAFMENARDEAWVG